MYRVIFNQKGGVGKTSISCNLAAISAAKGYRTLLIDLDVQGNSSAYLMGDDYSAVQNNVATYFKQFLSVLKLKRSARNFVHVTPYDNLYVMPSSPDLAGLEHELESRNKIYKLRNALKELNSEFDRVYIDTPPAYNFFTSAALVAADSLLVPFDCDRFSLQALYGLIDVVTDIQEDHNPQLTIEGIVVNQFHAQARLPRQFVETIRSEGLPLIEPFLPSSVKMKESRENSMPLIHFAPKHKLTLRYEALFCQLEPEFAEDCVSEL